MIISGMINTGSLAFTQLLSPNHVDSSVCYERGFITAGSGGLNYINMEEPVLGSVNAGFKTAMSDFGRSNQKRPRIVSIFGSASGPINLALYNDIKSDAIYSKEFAFTGESRMELVELTIPRIICARSWAFSINNVGTDSFFTIANIRCHFTIRPVRPRTIY